MCPECGTDHDGLPGTTAGGRLRCLEAQARALDPAAADETARWREYIELRQANALGLGPEPGDITGEDDA